MIVDECSTGIDPKARHLVWQVLKPESRDGYDLPSILLSTHYLDEAERLGTRIGILIDGELVSTGTLASLQARYCDSFFVEIALTEEAPEQCSRCRVRCIREQRNVGGGIRGIAVSVQVEGAI